MENLFTVIACVIGIMGTLAIVLGIFALEALIIWGVGNAIIYLFAISATWTYWQSCVTAFLAWGVRKIVKFCIR
jgi:hypothetical protein